MTNAVRPTIVRSVCRQIRRTLRASWDVLKAMNEKVAHEHMECSVALNDAARRLSDFSERQKAKRKTVSSYISI